MPRCCASLTPSDFEEAERLAALSSVPVERIRFSLIGDLFEIRDSLDDSVIAHRDTSEIEWQPSA